MTLQLSDEHLYIFLHLPRTGGTTLRRNILRSRPANEVLTYYQYVDGGVDTRFTTKNAIRDHIRSLTSAQRKNIRIIYGHEVFYGIHELFDRPARYIVFMREPNELIRSEYAYSCTDPFLAPLIKAQTGELRPFSECSLTMSRFPVRFLEQRMFGESLSYLELMQATTRTVEQNVVDSIEHILSDFFFIGITERSGRDISYISDLMGISEQFTRENPSNNTDYVDSEGRPHIDNALEDLYRFAYARNQTFKHPIRS